MTLSSLYLGQNGTIVTIVYEGHAGFVVSTVDPLIPSEPRAPNLGLSWIDD